MTEVLKVRNPLHPSYHLLALIEGAWVEVTRKIAGLENDPDELVSWEDCSFIDDGEALEIMERQQWVAMQIVYHPGGALWASSFDGGYIVRARGLEPTYYEEYEYDEFAGWADDVAHLSFSGVNMNKLSVAEVAIGNLIDVL